MGQVHANTTTPSSTKATIESVIYVQPLFKDENVLRALYLDKMLSPVDIARELLSSRQNIKKHLLLYGIPLRPEDQRRMYRHRFEMKASPQSAAQPGRVAEETIRIMQSLRSQGLSYEKIATVLNETGRKTKMGKGKWYANTVFKILNRKI